MHQRAPFSQEQIEGLKAYQACDSFHPYTCPNPYGVSSLKHGNDEKLVPSEDGLFCLKCKFVQDWAINWTTDASMVKGQWYRNTFSLI